MKKNTEKPDDFQIDRYLLENPEIMQACLVKMVINHIPEVTASLISGFRKQGLTHKQISDKFGINKGMCFKLENLQFWPKSDKKQRILIKKVMELIKNDKNGV